MLNVELGIPCDTASNFHNATGFSRQMMEKAKAAATQAAAAAEAEMNKTRQYIMRGFGNAILQANSAEALNAALDKLAQEKRNVGGGNLMGAVSVFGQTFIKGRTPHTCTTAECSKRTLDAIVEFEKNNRSIVDEKRKQFSTTNTQIKKQGSTLINRIREQMKKAEAEAKAKEAAEAAAKAEPMDYPPPMPPNTIPPIPSITPTPMPSVEEQGATVGGGAEAGATDTPKDAVLIGGKEIKKSTLIFGAVGLGIVGLLYYKLR